MEKGIIRLDKADIDIQYAYMDMVCALLAQSGREHYACVKTYGCQQNEADSERIAGMAERMGYVITDDEGAADLIIVNTCAVREHAEQKALSVTGQFKHLKEKNKGLLIGICGCMVSQEHRRDDIKFKYPYVDFLFGTSMLYKFPQILYTKMTQKKRGFYLDDSDGNVAEGLPQRRVSRYKAWVSIMYGCNNFCTYCVVPYVRGRERSRRREDVLCQIRELVADGCCDITLLGQNVNSYGRDLYAREEYDFSDLLSDINDIDGEFIIRFMTSHPKDASHRLIDTMARCSKVAPQLHLPLQSGSDRVLERMNRRYTLASYLGLLSYLREKIPNATVTSDIIVGFPGEGEEDFDSTLRALREARYDMIFSFIYSKRKGTPAAEYAEQVSDAVKSARFRRLLDEQNGISREKNEALLNTVQTVLCEGKSKNNPDFRTGRTPGGKVVNFRADDSCDGSFIKVKITSAETFSLFGEVTE